MKKKQVNGRNTCEKLHQKYRKLNNPGVLGVKFMALICTKIFQIKK